MQVVAENKAAAASKERRYFLGIKSGAFDRLIDISYVLKPRTEKRGPQFGYKKHKPTKIKFQHYENENAKIVLKSC